jgi:hypothetical protein
LTDNETQRIGKLNSRINAQTNYPIVNRGTLAAEIAKPEPSTDGLPRLNRAK